MNYIYDFSVSCLTGKTKGTSGAGLLPSITDEGRGRLTLRIRRHPATIDASMVSSEPSDLMSEMKLFGHEDNWFRSDGLGTTYEITDISGSKIFYAGQLCGKDQGGSDCDIDLPEGSYIWRVNGALDPHRDQIAWYFCDSQGGSRTELLFDVDSNNHCIPVHKRFSNDKEDEFNPDDADIIHNERSLDKTDGLEYI